jgi:hypothetical protein
MKYVWVFFEKSVVKVQVWLKFDNNGHFTVRPVYIICPWILLIMRNFLGESCRENRNTHFTFDNFSPSPQIVRSLNNVEKYGRGRQNRTRRMRFACRVIKVRIQTRYFTLVTLPWQERLRERASVLSYTYCFFLLFSGATPEGFPSPCSPCTVFHSEFLDTFVLSPYKLISVRPVVS